MSNSDAPIGGNGKKEAKVNKTEDVDKLLDKYFEELEKDGYNKIQIRALSFDVPEVSIKSKGGDENEQGSNFIGAINVLENGKRDFVLEEIAKGAGLNIKLADLRKVKAKTEKIKKDKLSNLKEREEEKKSSDENKTR